MTMRQRHPGMTAKRKSGVRHDWIACRKGKKDPQSKKREIFKEEEGGNVTPQPLWHALDIIDNPNRLVFDRPIHAPGSVGQCSD